MLKAIEFDKRIDQGRIILDGIIIEYQNQVFLRKNDDSMKQVVIPLTSKYVNAKGCFGYN